MRTTLDNTHLERAASQLGYKKVEPRSTGGLAWNYQGCAYLKSDGDIEQIIILADENNDDQPVFVLYFSFGEDVKDIEMTWIGMKALLAFATGDVISKIVGYQLKNFFLNYKDGDSIVDCIRDIDHTFVTPDVYKVHN